MSKRKALRLQKGTILKERNSTHPLKSPILNRWGSFFEAKNVSSLELKRRSKKNFLIFVPFI